MNGLLYLTAGQSGAPKGDDKIQNGFRVKTVLITNNIHW